jgi:hypothetical protein
MVGEKSVKTRTRQLAKLLDRYYFPIILGIGLILRLITIQSHEIAYDDAFSFILSQKNFQTIVHGTIADTMPPMYYFLLHLFISINSQLWFVRLANVILNLSAISIFYLTIKNLFGRNEALIAIFLACISPFQIYHSQELRMYSLLLAGQAGYFFAMSKIVLCKEPPKILIWITAVFSGTVAMYSHNLAIVGILTANLLLFLNKDWKKIKQFIGIQAAILLLFLPWAIFLPQQIAKVQNAFWTPVPGIAEIIQSFLLLFAFAPMPSIWIAIVLVLIIQIFVLFLFWLIKNKVRKLKVILSIVIAIPLILFLVSVFFQPVFVPRIFIFSALLAFGCLGTFIVRSWNNGIGKYILLSAVFVAIISLPYYYSFKSFPRSNFLSVSRYLEEENESNILILHDNKLSFFPTLVYAPDLNQAYLRDEPNTPNDTLALESQRALGYLAIKEINDILPMEKLYFIDFVTVESEYKNLGIENPKTIFLRGIYGPVKQKKIIGDVNIYYFEKSNE